MCPRALPETKKISKKAKNKRAKIKKERHSLKLRNVPKIKNHTNK
jgi:hypothetical protein